MTAEPDLAVHLVRVLTPAIELVTYRSVVDRGPGEAPAVALRSSIWSLGGDGHSRIFHRGTPAR